MRVGWGGDGRRVDVVEVWGGGVRVVGLMVGVGEIG